MIGMYRDRQPMRSQRPPVAVMPSWVIWVGAVVFPLLALGLIGLLLLRFGSGTPQDRAQLDVIRLAGTFVVGTGGAIALLLSARRQRSTEIALRLQDADLHQKELAAEDSRYDADERRVTELYTAAVEQLGSDKAPVRMGGLYALERLAQDNTGHRQTVVEVLCAYLRMPGPDECLSGQSSDIGQESREHREEHQVRRAAQHILVRHMRLPSSDSSSMGATEFWPGIEIDLTGATLHNWDFEGCRAEKATFSNAVFRGSRTSFRSAIFAGRAWFRGATFCNDVLFVDAHFCGRAEFERVCFNGSAWFESAKFSNSVWFDSTEFYSEAIFSDSAVQGDAYFSRVCFHGETWLDASTPESLRLLYAFARIDYVSPSLPPGWKLESIPQEECASSSMWNLIGPIGNTS